MALPKSRTFVIRKRKKAKEGRERKRQLRVKGSTQSYKALFGEEKKA